MDSEIPPHQQVTSARQKCVKMTLPLYPSGLFVEQAQKSILEFIREITSGAQSVLL